MSVYVIRAVDSGRQKVGFSNNPERRFHDIQAYSPEVLELVHVSEGTRFAESTAHDRLAKQGYLQKVRMPGLAQRVLITADSIDAYEELMAEQARRLSIIEGAVA